jgi:hypothetical protein
MLHSTHSSETPGGHERGGSSRCGWCPHEGVPGAPPPKLGAGENKGKLLVGRKTFTFLSSKKLFTKSTSSWRCRNRIQEELKRAVSSIQSRIVDCWQAGKGFSHHFFGDACSEATINCSLRRAIYEGQWKSKTCTRFAISTRMGLQME